MGKIIKLDSTDTKIMMQYLKEVTNKFCEIDSEISEKGICECDVISSLKATFDTFVDEISKEKPYINGEYNPNYGDERICVCGHSYVRHFDTYEYMDPIGCKYCGCDKFVEKK